MFNWIATLYKGSITFESPMLYALTFIFLFVVGGLTGPFLGALATNVQLHDTYFVVAHFHYTMMGGTVMGFFAGLHYWFPKMTGRMLNEKVARTAWALIFVGFNVTFFTMFIVGTRGMPRRYAEYLPKFHVENVISTIGSVVLAAGILVMCWNFLQGLRKGAPAPANPWRALTPGVAGRLAARDRELPRDPGGDRLAVRLREAEGVRPSMSGHPRANTRTRPSPSRSAKLGVWTFLATEVLLFGALFTAYTVFRMKYPEMFRVEHVKLDRVLGAVNTVVLITSSSDGRARRGRDQAGEGAAASRRASARRSSWRPSSSASSTWSTPRSSTTGCTRGTNLFFSLYFMMTGLHGIHVLLGMGLLSYVIVLSRRGRLSANYYHAGGDVGALLALRGPGLDLPVPAALPDRVRGSMAHGTGNSRRTGIAVFVALLLLTVVTVLVSYVDLGLWNAVVALLIASVKASLVALFFMHLKGERPPGVGLRPGADRSSSPSSSSGRWSTRCCADPPGEDNSPICRGR